MAIGLAQSELALRTLHVLEDVMVLPRRLVLALSPETTSAESEMQRLRGVWGAALHGLDSDAYETVFHPADSVPPKYILRPAGRSPQQSPGFDFILTGAGIRFDEPALRAWDIASGMGLGKQRRPFHVRSRSVLDAAGRAARSSQPWPVTKACWPIPGTPETSPCSLNFLTPLALHHDQRLIEQPTLKDLVAKGCRRVESLLPAKHVAEWRQLKGDLISTAAEVVSIPRFAEPLGVARYSGSQRRDFPIPCVAGRIDLPQGPSATWPLLAALQWLHVGKGTNIGLGRVEISSTQSASSFY